MAQEDIDIRINTKLGEVDKAGSDLRQLRGLLKDLQSLGEEVGDTTSDSFKRLQNTINSVEGKIGDASDRLRTISGEPLERVNNGFSLMSEGLSNLDFGKAKIGLDGMTEGIGKLNFKELNKGLKDVSGSFLKLGVAIITNPLFLLATTIILIIKNFDKLKAAGGAVGAMFSAIGDVIKWATDTLLKFSDAIGLTDTKAQQMAASIKSAGDAAQYAADKQAELNIELDKMEGKSTIWKEYLQAVKAVKKAEEELAEVRKKGEDETEALNKVNLAKIQVQKLYKVNKIAIDKEIELSDLELQKKQAENQKKGRTRDLAIAAIQRKIDNLNREKDADKQINDIKGFNKMSLDIQKSSFDDKISNLKTQRTELTKEISKLEKDVAMGTLLEPGNIILPGIVDEKKVNEAVKNLKIAKGKLEQIDKEIVENTKKSTDESVNIVIDGLERVNTTQQRENETNKLSTKKANEEISDINKTYNDKELDEVLKKNKRLQDVNKSKFDKQIEDDNLNWAQKIDAEKGFFDKELELINQEYRLQLKRSNLTEEDKLKLRQDYVLKTEELYKNHFGTVDKLYENSGNNILKNIQKTIDELLTSSINSSADRIIATTDMELNAIEQGNAAQLASLQTHLDHTGGIRTRHEKQLIEQLSKSRSDILEIQRLKELDAAGNDAEAKLAIDKKYSNLEKNLTEETSAAKIQANVETIDKIAGYAAQGLEATQLIMDLGSLKDKERLKKGEITEEQFQRREFNRKKAASIASIVMNTAEAISKAIALSPATGGLPFSGIAAALGALQFAKVTSTTFEYASPAQSTSTSSGSSGASTNRDLAAPGNPYFGQGFLNLNSFNPNMMGGMKVYVLEQDIRNAMNRATVLNNRNIF